jgi:hypothetical protein
VLDLRVKESNGANLVEFFIIVTTTTTTIIFNITVSRI